MNSLVKYILKRAKEYQYSLFDFRMRMFKLGFERDYTLFNTWHLSYANTLDVFLRGDIMFVSYQIGTQWYLDAFEGNEHRLHQIDEDDDTIMGIFKKNLGIQAPCTLDDI